jgi:glycogen debranching enzyme
LDEAKTPHYYITTKASPADDRTRVLKYGKLFAIFDHYGDVEPVGLGEEGIFFEGTRFLSELALYIGEQRPLLLSSTVREDNSLFTADLTNVDIARDGQVAIPRGTVHVTRSKFLWRSVCYERINVANYGLDPIQIPFRMDFDADFADIFEVRGARRARRGQRLDTAVEGDTVTLSYRGLDGIVRRTRIWCLPPPTAISSTSCHFDLSLQPRQEVQMALGVTCFSGSTPPDGTIPYDQALATTTSEMQVAGNYSCEISSSSEEFNDWMRRSVADIQMMTVGNPEENYPYAGVPWFSTVFGRDGIITALECLWANPQIARGVLQYLAATQARDVIPESDAEPGKILHETRRGEMAALGEIPFGRYYGSVDSTPMFVMLAAAYYQRTADRDFIESLWPHIELALGWIDRYGDIDGDGFVEYSRHSAKGLIQQGWKDSNDSIFHADGNLAEPPIALCEVQGYTFSAKRSAARLAEVLGKWDRVDRLESQARKLRERFEELFWCPEVGTYALALDGRKKPCQVRTSNPGHCLYTRIANPSRASAVADLLLGPDFFSGWGIRTVASSEARYNPVSYHNGSVWPHDNAIIAKGLSNYGFKEQAVRILTALLDVSDFVDLHRLPELYCGLPRRAGEGPTLYPVACAPQAWSAGAIYMLLEACLGISIDASNRQIKFECPCLPKEISRLWIKKLAIEQDSVDVLLELVNGVTRVQVLEKRGAIEVDSQ